MALAAIAASAETSPAASDFPAKGEISVEQKKKKFRENEESFKKNCPFGGNLNPPMGVLCLTVCFSWLIRGGVAPVAGPIRSSSLGSVK